MAYGAYADPRYGSGFDSHQNTFFLFLQITEPSYRSEKKFCEPLNITSHHNFVGASNNHKAVEISYDDRRYWMKHTVQMKYTDAEWSALWNLVHQPSIREIFYMYLITCVDTSNLKIGRAPMTATKASAASEGCPLVIKWLKEVIMEDPAAAAHVPSVVGENYDLRSKWEDDLKVMTFKSRDPSSAAFHYMQNYDDAMLKDDLGSPGRRSNVACVLPHNHLVSCVLRHFKGQAWTKANTDDISRNLEKLGIEKKTLKLAGTSRRNLWAFPSIQGIIYLLLKRGWMTLNEAKDTVAAEEV